VVVGDRGRVVLPSAVRASLGIETGTRMMLTSEGDGSLRLRPFGAVAEESRGMLADLADPETSMVDELIADRRAEQAREDVE